MLREIAPIIGKHLGALAKDLSEARVSPDYILFAVALSQFLGEASTALTYSSDRVLALHQSLISSSLDFIQRWDDWAASMLFEKRATKILHEFLIRFSKGTIKAYRIWKIDTQKDS